MTQYDLLTNEPIEEDRFELLAGPRYEFLTNRREFVQLLGAGIVISVAASRGMAQRPSGRRGSEHSTAKASDRLHIGTDGIVTILTGKVEVGQGSRTQVCQAAAEELRVPLSSVRVVMGDTALCPNDGGTSGSRTTPSTIPRVRAAAAVAREALLKLAAKKMQASVDALTIEDGTITDSQSKRSTTYAALAEDENLRTQLEQQSGSSPTLTPTNDWRILGTTAHKVNGKDVVTGVHRYPSDMTRPEMQYGKILRPPCFGATLKSIDLSVAQRMDGVTVARDGDFVGCVAKTSWAAKKAIEALSKSAEWKIPNTSEQPQSATMAAYLKEHVSPDSRGSRGGGRRGGEGSSSAESVKQALANAKRSLSANYEIAFIQHAPMEPHAALAEWTDGKLTVWTATQNPTRVREELVRAFHLAPDKARVIVPDAGGAFGGKHTGEVALEAARLAKEANQPVSVRWTREEEFTWAYFRPGGLIEVAAGLDDAQKIAAWDFVNYNSGGSAITMPYEVSAKSTRFVACDSPLRPGSYRGLASAANNFARESFIDELAADVQVDPLEFRLRQLPEGRLRDVLIAACERFGWAKRKDERQQNRGIGLACGTEKGSYVAACVEVEVDRVQGKINVLNICQAFECGAIQNPANLRAQIEGCIIMGLGGALTEQIQYAEGKILNPHFSQYTVPRIADVPPLDIVLVNRTDLDSAGAGETPIMAIAPAIGNAVFRATGVRLRSLPLRGEQLKQA